MLLEEEALKNESTAWDKVLLARNCKRFRSLDFVDILFEDFFELHGDYYNGDDKSIIGGIAFFNKLPVTVICQQKGKDNKEMIYRQYGMTMPEGYRKSLRLMKQAEKFKRPIICFIDTPGAFPGVVAEERGQAEAIAKNLFEMSSIKVPIISIILGEGGSGGALALGLANKVIMFENAIFSVVSPEGCASILWKDSKMAPYVAEHLKLTSKDLNTFGIIDYIVSEEGSFSDICERLSNYITEILLELRNNSGEQLMNNRRLKYRLIDLKYHEKYSQTYE